MNKIESLKRRLEILNRKDRLTRADRLEIASIERQLQSAKAFQVEQEIKREEIPYNRTLECSLKRIREHFGDKKRKEVD